jgi:site-specific DNA recombinase
MNVVIWARVSSREQSEGYSLDAQIRINRDKAEREGWKILREFVVAESARRGAERIVFNEMFQWVKKNAKRMKIDAILAHKLDRICRNMRDAVRVQELEDAIGVKTIFVDNEFGPGAAGALSFNVMAAVSQYYSDNLRQEVRKGQEEKVRQGWLPCGVPYGYMNSGDRDEPITPHPVKSKLVVRAFQLYSQGGMTFDMIGEQLHREGYIYRPSTPRMSPGSISYMMANRFYVGDIVWRGQIYPGKHRPLIERHTFQLCRALLKGKNRRTKRQTHTFANGLILCDHCGSMITGECIRRKLSGGGVRLHTYYRCANNKPGDDHPTVRWREADLETRSLLNSNLCRCQRPRPATGSGIRSTKRSDACVATRTSRSESSAARRSSCRSKTSGCCPCTLKATSTRGHTRTVRRRCSAKSENWRTVFRPAGTSIRRAGTWRFASSTSRSGRWRCGEV